MTSALGTSTGLPITFAYTWLSTGLRCGMPPPLMMRRTGTPCSSMRSRITRVWNAVPSMAANSSSCAVVVSRQPSVTPLSSGFTSTVRSPLSQVMPQQAGLPCPVPVESLREGGDGRARALRDGVEDVAGGRQSGLDAGLFGVDRARNDAADARNQGRRVGDRHDAGGGADHVDDVADAAARADGVPMRVEGAGRDRDAGTQSEALGPGGARASRPARLLVAYTPPILARTPASSGSTATRKSSGGRPPSCSFHIHLCPMAQMLRGTAAGSLMPHRTAAAMSQCSSAVAMRSRLAGLWRSQCSSLAQPHSEE